MTISLSIAERLQLSSFLNSFQGKDFETLVEVWALLEKIKIGVEEGKEIELKIEGSTIQWNQEKAPDKEFEISSDEKKVFKDEFEARSKDKKLGSELYNLAQVYIKLN